MWGGVADRAPVLLAEDLRVVEALGPRRENDVLREASVSLHHLEKATTSLYPPPW